jgi:short subunit dehydrogenase-like uncharacterized protein
VRHSGSQAKATPADMRVVVLGGYGAFGGRLARLLLRAGHEVLVAGRDPPRALAFVREHGGQPLLLDLREDLSPIARAAPGPVVDAAGPFQTYETNTYRVARFCIENGINYIDLSDDAGFAAGIAALDDMATRTGVFALSGASSVPTISAAAVAVVSGHPASGSAASWQRKPRIRRRRPFPF